MKVLLGIFIVGSAVAQVPVPGNCPAIKSMTNFNMTKLFGKWYNAAFYFTGYNIPDKCPTTTYGSKENGDYYFLYSAIIPSTGKELTQPCPIWQQIAGTSRLIGAAPQIAGATAPYTILTDYRSYFIEWNCVDIQDKSLKAVWIYTRKPNPSENTMDTAYKTLEKYYISRNLFSKANRDNCPEGH